MKYINVFHIHFLYYELMDYTDWLDSTWMCRYFTIGALQIEFNQLFFLTYSHFESNQCCMTTCHQYEIEKLFTENRAIEGVCYDKQ